jgi:hypothetical protein
MGLTQVHPGPEATFHSFIPAKLMPPVPYFWYNPDNIERNHHHPTLENLL